MKTDFINAEWIKKYCQVTIDEEREQWNKHYRQKNDTWINASHSGKVHALEDLKSLIEQIEKIKEDKPNDKGCDNR
jgi:hypothetical protein